MIRILRCDNSDCQKCKECYRYMSEILDNETTNYEHICGDWNQYKHIYEIGDKPIRKEELSE